jgi:hypothetical protein
MKTTISPILHFLRVALRLHGHLPTKFITTILFIAIAVFCASAQVPTIDIANLEKSIAQLKALYDQIQQGKQLLKQIGDAADIQDIAGAAQTLSGFGNLGTTQTAPNQSSGSATTPVTGQGGMTTDGGGVFTPVSTEIEVADGTSVPRSADAYLKFEVLYQSIEQYNTVNKDTQRRRDSLRQAMRSTTEGLAKAQSDAEVQKLTGILAAQTSELATINAERSEAANRVLIVQAANQADLERQQQAELELRAANLQSAFRESARFFKADSRPTLISKPSKISR